MTSSMAALPLHFVKKHKISQFVGVSRIYLEIRSTASKKSFLLDVKCPWRDLNSRPPDFPVKDLEFCFESYEFHRGVRVLYSLLKRGRGARA